jgi:hypothetical protein
MPFVAVKFMSRRQEFDLVNGPSLCPAVQSLSSIATRTAAVASLQRFIFALYQAAFRPSETFHPPERRAAFGIFISDRE